MTTEIKKLPKERLYSLDTLRGFDMFWIVGGGGLIKALSKATEWGWMEGLAEQFHHAKWEGFNFEDLIFPLFMFISGVAIPFALTSRVEKGVEKSILFKKVFKRMLLLVLFGLIYNGVFKDGFENPRYLSVLSQIGIGYFFAAMIVVYSKTLKNRIFWLVGILIGITILHFFVPVPGFGPGVLTPEGSINAWIDQTFLPGELISGTYDPEGILSIVSATSITLFGSFAGFILRNKSFSQLKKTKSLLVFGFALILFALIIAPVYPIIKNMWTASFNLLTAGISFVLMALFYFIIDVKMWRNWTLFFRVIGLNSIIIYMGDRIVDTWGIAEFFLGFIATPMGDYGLALIILGSICLEWALLYYLFKNKIFLRV